MQVCTTISHGIRACELPHGIRSHDISHGIKAQEFVINAQTILFAGIEDWNEHREWIEAQSLF